MKTLYKDLTGGDLGSVVVVTFDIVTGRIALVYEEAKPAPVYWKCAGGMVEEKKDRDQKHPGDLDLMAENAARREVEEETGVKLEVVHLVLVEDKTSRQGGLHLKRIFVGAGDFSTLKRRGDEGEIVRAFTLAEARGLPNFMPVHRRYLDLAEEEIKRLSQELST